MGRKLRIVQIDREELVIKSPSDELIAEARAVMGKPQGVLTVERKGTVYHLASRSIVRLEVEHDDEDDDTSGKS